MKRSLLFGIVLLSLSGSLLLWYDSSADPCGGRCTGSAYCTACTNCSRCHHCKYGGSCGVCAAPEPKALRTKKTAAHTGAGSVKKAGSSVKASSRSSGSGPSHAPAPAVSSPAASNIHVVKAASVQVRKEPSAKAEVLCTLHHKRAVRVLKKVNTTWVEIEAFCDGTNRRITGYVHRSALR